MSRRPVPVPPTTSTPVVVVPTAANDNRALGLGDPLVRAALRHFGAQGMAAAGDALRRAEAAGRAGEPTMQARWQAIGRLLDPRLARAHASTLQDTDYCYCELISYD